MFHLPMQYQLTIKFLQNAVPVNRVYAVPVNQSKNTSAVFSYYSNNVLRLFTSVNVHW